MKARKIICMLFISLFICFGFINELRAAEIDYDGRVSAMGYVPSELDDNAPAVEEDIAVQSEDSLPSHYMDDIASLRKKYPPTRDQSPYGTCWAHGATACAEFSMINQGYVNEEDATSIDYSELQAAYYAFHKQDDPMDGTKGDVIKTNRDYLNQGYNSNGVMRTLIQWMGMADEKTVPYRMARDTYSNPLDDSLAYDYNVAHLMETRLINIKTNPNIAKQAIIDNGALSIVFGVYDSYAKGASYYCDDDRLSTNHLVSVVGWDDNYSADNFGIRPQGDGAWLCRNSWSTYVGNNMYSYFYLSYYDKTLLSTAYEFIYEPAEFHDNNYQYDGGDYTLTRENHPIVGNLFYVQGVGGSDKEVLDAISFSATHYANVDYEVKIYTDVDPDEGPLLSNLDEDNIITGTTTTAGIYRVNLNKPIVLDRGTYFAVVVSTEGGRQGKIDWEYGSNVNTVFASKYQSFANRGAPEKWAYHVMEKPGSGFGNVCIRAYTYNVDSSMVGKYNITFKPNGGQGDMPDASNIACDDEYQLPSNCYTKAGYNFKSWNTKPNGTGIAYSDNQLVEGLSGYGRNYILYAQWEPIEYSIHYDANGGNGAMDDTIGVKYNDRINLPACAFNNDENGLVFDSWNTKSDGSGNRFVDCAEVSELLDTDGTITLYAQWTDNANYFTIRNNVLIKYEGDSRNNIYIPDEVVKIGDSAFYGHKEIKKVILPELLKEIGDEAFCHCENLEEVEWSGELQVIGASAFCNTAIKEADIQSVTYLAEGVFSKCSSLEEVHLPEKVNLDNHRNASWGDSLFSQCSKLKSVKLPTGLKGLGEYTFSGCSSLEEVILPDDMVSIGNDSIGGYFVFAGCEAVKTLELPKMLENAYGITGLTGLTSLYVHKPVSYLSQIRADNKLTIYGQSGTYSEEYAAKYGYDFVDYYDEGSVYYIKYDPNKGNGSAYSKRVMGPTVLDSYKFSRSYYKFDGWNTKADGSGDFYEDRACVEDLASDNDTITLYAQWIPEEYEITLDAKGGNLDTTMLKVHYGGKYGELPIPAKKGYEFNGWSENEYGYPIINSETEVRTNKNHTLYASWSPMEIAIELRMNLPGDSNTNYWSYSLNYGSELRLGSISKPTAKGYLFTGWFYEPEGGEKADDIITIDREESLILYAHWIENPHTVVFMGGEDGSKKLYELTVLDGFSIYETEDILGIDDSTIIGDCDYLAEWIDSEGAIYDIKTPVTKDITLTAYYFDAIKVSGVTCNIDDLSIVESGTKLILKSAQDVDIFYTLDGSEPRRNSRKYTAPIILNSEEGIKEIKVKAIAVKDKCISSDVTEINIYVRAKNEMDDVMRKDMLAEGYSEIPGGLWCHIITPEDELIYTGSAVVPQIRVYYGKKLLTEKEGYTLSYKNNINVTKQGAAVTVKCKSPYTGQVSYPYVIKPRNIADKNVVIIGNVDAYSKSKKTPSFTITYKGKALRVKTNYNVSLAEGGECINPGIYDCIIEGYGNFTGTTHADYVISAAALMSKAAVSSIRMQDYDFGNAICPEVTVKSGSNPLTKDVDYTVKYYNNINAGKASVVISAINDDPTKLGSVYGSKTVYFQIKGISFNKVKINNFASTFTYSGEEIKQSAVLTYGDTELKENKDYTAVYSKNVLAGNAKVVYTGISGFTGSVSKTYAIKPIEFTGNLVINEGEPIICDYTYQGAKPNPIVTYNSNTLILGKDYTISYKNNTKVGYNNTELVITGKGNYKGTQKEPFTINKRDIKDLSAQLSDVIYKEKTGAYKANIKIYDDKHLLTAVKEYDKLNIEYRYVYRTILDGGVIRRPGDLVENSDIPLPGTRIRYKVTGAGNYEGSITGTYRIIAADIKSAVVKIEKQKYTGIGIVPEPSDISVKVGAVPLTESDYRIVSVKNNIWPGQAEIVLEGIGKYGGTKTIKYNIMK